MQRAIILFVKWPLPGRVKTRIAATLGPERAADIYRRLVAAVCARLPRDTPVLVCFDPPALAAEVRAWLAPLLPQAVAWMPQSPGDLGQRLGDAFAAAFAGGWRRLAVIGTDCVEITPQTFAEAWCALDSSDAVIGPTHDGGYYLLALAARHDALFDNIRWSTPHTLADTTARATAAELKITRLSTLNDVDTAEDWERACSADAALAE